MCCRCSWRLGAEFDTSLVDIALTSFCHNRSAWLEGKTRRVDGWTEYDAFLHEKLEPPSPSFCYF